MITIRLLDPVSWQIQAYGVDGGKVYLDVDERFNIRATKSLEELTEAEKIAREASLSGPVPATAKNKALLAQYSANIWERSKEVFSQRVEVKQGEYQLTLTRMTVSGINDREQEYELELFGGGWIDDLERTPAQALDLGTFNYTKANVEAAWDNQATPAVPAIGDYGGFWTPGNITRKDLRFWFNLFNLLDQAFCQTTNYKLKSPYLESTVGQSLYAYLSPENWHSYRDKNDQFRVFLDIASPKTFDGSPESDIWDEVYDPLGLWDTSPTNLNEYIYPPAGVDELDIEFEIRGMEITLPPSPGPGRFYIIVYKTSITGAAFDPAWSTSVQGSTTQTTRIEINEKFRIPATNNGDRFGMIIGYQHTPIGGSAVYYQFDVEAGEFFIRPDPPYYINNDTVTLADLIDPAINCLDIFKAALHLFNGKIETDESEKTVTVYPPFDAEQLGENIEGFFKRNAGQQDVLVEPRSMVTESKEADIDRYVELKFRDSTDKYIEELTTGELYSRTVDLGYGKVQTNKVENELFEPTAERFTEPDQTGGDGIYLPVLYDNTEGKRSTKLGPRIGWHYGDVRQVDSDGQRSYKFEGVVTQSFGYISQRPTVARVNNEPDVPIIFAENEKDLWRLFYQRWLREQYALVSYEFLLYLELKDYLELSFRRPVGFTYEETYLLFQVIEIRDYDVQANTATPVKMKLLQC